MALRLATTSHCRREPSERDWMRKEMYGVLHKLGRSLRKRFTKLRIALKAALAD